MSAGAEPEPRLGAYGLTLPGLAGDQWLNPAPATWPVWRFVESSEPAPRSGSSDDVAVVRWASGHTEHIDRTAATTTFSGGPPLPSFSFVHPILTATAAAHAHWTGRVTFHAGAFLGPDGGVWGVLGDREQGKSSALTWLAASGAQVFSDDLLITDGDVVVAGPRCIDLREASARYFGMGSDIGLLGERHRWRVDLSAVPPEAALRGWVVLDWGDEPTVTEVSAAQRPAHLAKGVALTVADQHPLAWLGALGRPMVLLSRPRSWAALDESMTLLLERLHRS